MKKDLPNAKQSAFLRAYATAGAISTAANIAKVARQTHYDWLRDDPEYAARFEQANTELIESLEAAVIESATIGIAEPVVYQGALQYEPLKNKDGSFKRTKKGEMRYSDKPLTIRKRSDVAAFFMLKAKRPDVYREHATVEHTGSIDLIERLAAGRDRIAKLEQEQS